VDVLSMEPTDAGDRIAVRDVMSSEESELLLPASYACRTQVSVVAGGRYVLLTSPTERGPTPLYLGVGAEYAVLPVEEGYVRTPLGARDAAALVRDARRGS
jgi:hypothetical protein